MRENGTKMKRIMTSLCTARVLADLLSDVDLASRC